MFSAQQQCAQRNYETYRKEKRDSTFAYLMSFQNYVLRVMTTWNFELHKEVKQYIENFKLPRQISVQKQKESFWKTSIINISSHDCIWKGSYKYDRTQMITNALILNARSIHYSCTIVKLAR